MTEKLTEKQELTLNVIKDYIQEHGYSPTIREICVECGVNSPATIHTSLKILKRKGYIDYVYNRNRTIRVLNERTE